jgi:anti-sigma regulatory factor (Ser/Thr protein kinase)
MTGNGHLPTGNGHVATGNGHVATGNSHLATGNSHLATGNSHLAGRIEVTLPASPEAASIGRAVAGAFCPVLDEHSAEDLMLLVSEVVGNSVRHPQVVGNVVSMELELIGGHLRVAVRDRGSGFRPPPPPDVDGDPTGGFGLYLVEQLADRWGVEADPNTEVWFELDVGRTA